MIGELSICLPVRVKAEVNHQLHKPRLNTCEAGFNALLWCRCGVHVVVIREATAAAVMLSVSMPARISCALDVADSAFAFFSATFLM